MTTIDCPRCGEPCPIGPQQSCHCTSCFTSFRADSPQSVLTDAERAAAEPSCATLDLEPLTTRKAERAALDRATCTGCGQLALDGTGTCATCRGAADRAASGTAMRLFTPPPAQLAGQLSF